jgi:hypothetical protein
MGRTTYVYDDPVTPPSESLHWSGLVHEPNDRLIKNLDELKAQFQADVVGAETNAQASRSKSDGQVLALWSCILGYCEALATHKNTDRRFNIYPIPIDALSRLVKDEFLPSLQCLGIDDSTIHRNAARLVATCIWSKVTSKKDSKDEQHANSLYVCRRGKIDSKSLDCFGAAACTVIGLLCLGYTSMLTLSEDHAYESHVDDEGDISKLATCEVAIPGNTLLVQNKRGREVRETFKDSKVLCPETSWLYMAKCPVLCDSMPMTMAAMLSNVNCSIESKVSGSNGSVNALQVSSGPLFDLKRELLWILRDGGHLSSFPFALCELGDCEESRASGRGDEWVQIDDIGADHPVLVIEALYHEAISICRAKYNDGQVYPYTYAGNFHKDGGQDEREQEYRLVEAIRCYAECSRVASSYVYEWGDSLQLTKVMTKLSECIMSGILFSSSGVRKWFDMENQVAAGTWLVAFFDSLLLWEERTGSQFLPILTAGHKTGISKLFSVFPHDARVEITALVSCDSTMAVPTADAPLPSKPITDSQMQHFKNPRSKRLAPNGLLLSALKRTKVSIGDMELAILVESSQDGRKSKRSRRDTRR